MKDEDKSKKQLVAEMKEMRHRFRVLEEIEVRWQRAEDALRAKEVRYRSLFENTGTAEDRNFLAKPGCRPGGWPSRKGT